MEQCINANQNQGPRSRLQTILPGLGIGIVLLGLLLAILDVVANQCTQGGIAIGAPDLSSFFHLAHGFYLVCAWVISCLFVLILIGVARAATARLQADRPHSPPRVGVVGQECLAVWPSRPALSGAPGLVFAYRTRLWFLCRGYPGCRL